MAVDIKGDTNQVREEFDNLSNPTQVFIWALVGLGVIIGLLLGGAIAYGVAVEEQDDGRECIELDDTLYCEDDGTAATGTDGTTGTDDTDADADDTLDEDTDADDGDDLEDVDDDEDA